MTKAIGLISWLRQITLFILIMKTITVIDKHPIFRAGLADFFGNNFNKVSIHEFDSIDHFEKSGNENSELVIVGNIAELPSAQFEYILKLKKKNRPAKIIMYDENPAVFKVLLLLKSGINGYLSKGSDTSELLKCIQHINEDQNFIGHDVLKLLVTDWITSIYQKKDRKAINLTHREFEIANFLAAGITISQISKKLQRQVSTICTIKKSLFTKLSITNVIDLKDALELQHIGNVKKRSR